MKRNLVFDSKFKKFPLKYIFQCILATITVFAILLFLNVLKETAIITALGASTFIIFTMPTQYSSDIRRLVGGYIVGITIGIIFYIIYNAQIESIHVFSEQTSLILFGAIAVGLAIFVMSIINAEHAPAAGIALGLVINNWDLSTILFIILAVTWLASVKHLLKGYLMDLISPYENIPTEHKR